MGVIMPIYTIGIIIFFLYTTMKIMFKNKNDEEDEEEDVHTSYSKKLYGDTNKYDEEYYNNYIKQYSQNLNGNLTNGVGPVVEESSPNSLSAQVEEIEEEMAEEYVYPEDGMVESSIGSLDEESEETESTESSVEDEPIPTVEEIPTIVPETKEPPVEPVKMNVTQPRRTFKMHPAAAAAAREFARDAAATGQPPPKTAEALPPQPEPPVATKTQDMAERLSGLWGQPKEQIDPRDVEISLLKARLEETERAMERIVAQMGAVTSRLAPHIISQAMDDVNSANKLQHRCQSAAVSSQCCEDPGKKAESLDREE